MEENSERPSYEPELTEPPTPSKAVAKYSPLQRLWLVFTSPGEVFKDIGIKPSWVLIAVVSVVLAVGAQFLIAGHVDTEATIRARLADRGSEMSEAQIETVVAQTEKISKFGPAITSVMAPILWALMAAIFLVVLKIVGSEIDFKTTLSTMLHAYWPAGVVQTVLTGVLIKRLDKVPQQELVNVVKANLGAFLSPDTPAWLTAAAGTFSVFNIWTVVLLIIGFGAAGKLPRNKAVIAALVPWVVWIVGKAGIAAIFG